MQLKEVHFGTGARPFLILPGLSVTDVFEASAWIAAAFADFARDYTVYLMDRRETIPPDFSIREMAQDIADTMQALGLREADVFGASQGGMIAQWLAIDHPKLVHRLLLASTLCRANETSNAAIGQWITLAEQGNADGLLHSFATLVYSTPVPISGAEEITQKQLNRFARIARGCLNFDCSAELGKIRCPALVLGSQQDRVIPAAAMLELSERLGCESFLYRQFGHAVYDEAPDFRARMLSFLQSV